MSGHFGSNVSLGYKRVTIANGDAKSHDDMAVPVRVRMDSHNSHMSHKSNKSAAPSFVGSYARSIMSFSLKKEITFTDTVAVMTGIMIGSGIFVSPVAIMSQCGSVGLSLMVWGASGILSMFVAMSYTELACMYQLAGGEYAYYKMVLGDLPAFLFAWMMLVLMDPAFFALLALTTSTYIFDPLFQGCQGPDIPMRVIAIGIVFAVAFLNCTLVKYVTRVQTVLAITKFLALIGITIVGFVNIFNGGTENLNKGFEGSTTDPGAVATAVFAGYFTYNGWQYLFALIEEVQNPEKVVPRGVYTSFILCTVIYMLVNVAYFAVLTPEELLNSDAVAVLFAQKTLGSFSVVIPIFVSCSTVGALNGSILGGSRVYYAAARDGLFPSFMAMISNHYRTPIPSVLVSCLITTCYIMTGSAITLLEYLGFMALMLAVVSIGCMLYVRYTQPENYRPYKVNLAFPIIGWIVATTLAVLGLIHDPVKNLTGVGLVMTGVPVYWLLRCNKRVTAAWFTTTLQKLLLVLPEHDDCS